MTTGPMNQFDYVDGQLRPTQAALFEQFAAANARAVAEHRPALDIPYGPHPRQILDLFRATTPRRGAIAYFHAGYWQSRDKSGFHFIAPPLTDGGFDVAIVNYPLSPDMRVAEIVDAASAAIERIAVITNEAPLILIGHSAGGHIVAELGMRHAPSRHHIAGMVSISGVFDLEPLIETTLNQKLALDLVAARGASPVHRVTGGAPRATFAVGELETGAFHDQTARMHRAWAGAGNPAAHLVVAGADHFSILNDLCDEAGELRAVVRRYAEATPA